MYRSTTTRRGAGRRMAGLGRLLCAGAALLLSATVQAQESTPIDLNTASAEQLAQAIGGVGAAKAQAIIAYRENHGAFESVDDLIDVPGIGLRTLERNRALLRVGPPVQGSGAPDDQQASVNQ